MEVLMRDLYCYECSLQFDKKYVFDDHLSDANGEELEIIQEPDIQSSLIIESKELEITHPEENSRKIESKRRKVSIKTASSHQGIKKFNCEICKAYFGQKAHLNIHVATVHEGKKAFKCDICNTELKSKQSMKKRNRSNVIFVTLTLNQDMA